MNLAKNYYKLSHDASLKIDNHLGLKLLKLYCEKSKKILDVGCGEGTRLSLFTPRKSHGFGIDASPEAVKLANKQFPKLKISLGQGEKLPYQSNYFDLVYSAFSIEHCQNPEDFISEMIRVCKPKGRIIIISPNFGAPSRRSPNSVQDPYQKFVEGLIKDIFPYPGLGWTQVTPKSSYTRIDADTTWEPYLHSIIEFLKIKNIAIDKYSSLWDLEPKTDLFRQNILKFLGKLEIWPVKYWGPQLFISGVK
jgi:demethylmenaquinone methyltransferase/2-methoxy-6-polyprenyl-1,4-benzoquinol methylase